jgi:hypothetical protein
LDWGKWEGNYGMEISPTEQTDSHWTELGIKWLKCVKTKK